MLIINSPLGCLKTFLLFVILVPKAMACQDLLLSKAWTKSAKARPAEIDAWRANLTARHILEQADTLARNVESAPQEVLDLLALARNFYTGAEPINAKLPRLFADNPILGEVEIILGHELDVLLPQLNALIEVQSYASSKAKTWFASLNSTQYFMLAAALTTFPEGRILDHRRTRAPKGLLALAQAFPKGISPELSLWEVVKHSFHLRVLAVSAAVSTERILASANRKHIAITPDNEDMVEWIIEKMDSENAQDPNFQAPPSHWLSSLKRVRRILFSPLKDQSFSSKSFGGSDGFQVFFFHDLFYEYLELLSGRHGLAPHEPYSTSTAQMFRDLVRVGFEEKDFMPGHGATLAMMTLYSDLFQFTLGRDLGRLLPPRLRLAAAAGLREYFGVANHIDADEKIESPSMASLLPEQSQTHEEEEDSPAPPVTAPPVAPQETSIPDLNFSDLQADQTHEIIFRRKNSKFIGVQRVVFTRTALTEMQERTFKDVAPETWVRALQMGIATEHGQRGIKFLKGGKKNGDGLQIELKILLSPWRLLGHYREGVFVFEAMRNPHD